MNYRIATRHDLPGYLKLAPQISDGQIYIAGWTTSLRVYNEILSRNTDLIVGVDDGTVLAALILVIVPGFSQGGRPWAMVEHVVVSREHRGKGIGKGLIQFAVDLAEKRNCYKVQLIANDVSSAFYDKQGFESADLVGFKKYLGRQK